MHSSRFIPPRINRPTVRSFERARKLLVVSMANGIAALSWKYYENSYLAAQRTLRRAAGQLRLKAGYIDAGE
jgi:hypothetical protein